VTAEAALMFGKTLLLFAFGTAPVHFALGQIVFKEQPAAPTLLRSRFDCRFTAGDRAFEYGFTLFTPVSAG
jgi:hypothetical protein